jgi:hypothetical protein
MMYRNLKYIYFLLVVISSSFLNGQEPVIIDFSINADGEVESSMSMDSATQSIGLTPTEFIFGDFSLYYERVLSGRFTASIGIGVTRNDNFGGLIFGEDVTWANSDIENRIGPSFSLAFRFYTKKAFKGFYIGTELKYRSYTWYNTLLTVLTDELDQRSYIMPRLNLGYSILTRHKLCFDFFVGIGMAHLSRHEIVRLGTPYEPNYTVENWTRFYPRINLGFKLAYAL